LNTAEWSRTWFPPVQTFINQVIATSCTLPSFLRQPTSRLIADAVEKSKTGGAGPRSAGFAIRSTPRLGDQQTARGFVASEGEISE
jgi:hypothetical protein